MISDRLKCIFIHIPKCGGTSLESALWLPEEKTDANLFGGLIDRYHNPYQTGALQHLKALAVRHVVGRERFDEYFKFTIIRNPFSRAVSQYNYSRESRFLRRYIGLGKRDDFKTYLQKIHRKSHVQWEPQVSFLYDHRGRQMVDYIGRLEDVDAAFTHICTEVGVTAELPHKKKSGQKAPYQSYYDEESIAYIEDVYADDLEVLGYRFEPLDEAAAVKTGTHG